MRAIILLAFVMLVGCGGGTSPSTSVDGGPASGGADGRDDAANNGTIGDTRGTTDAGTELAGQIIAMDHGYILGPPTDNQAIVTVSASHLGFPPKMTSYTPAADRFFSNAKGDLFLLSIGLIAGDGSGPANGILYKYNSNLDLQWSMPLPTLLTVPGLGINHNALIPTAADDFYFGGLTRAVGSFTYSFTVGKLNSDGTLDWSKNWGNSATDVNMVPQANVDSTTVTTDGALIAVGRLYDETPKTPVAKGFWMTRHEADGTETFLKQYLCSDFKSRGKNNCYAYDNKLLIDPAGDIVMNVPGVDIWKFDPQQGAVVSLTPIVNEDRFLATRSLNFGIANDGNGFYSWSMLLDAEYSRVKYRFPNGGTSGLGRYNADGTLLWYRYAEPPRMAVDAAQNRTWTGIITGSVVGGFSRIDVLKDAIYLSGTYQNSYTADLEDRTNATFPMYVGRYDVNGDRVWFQELTLEGYVPTYPNFGAGGEPVILGIQLDSTGNPVVAVEFKNQGYLFKLNATDGSVM